MSKIILYMHSGSGNHGCEALARTIRKKINFDNVYLNSNSIEEDIKYGLDKEFTKIIQKKSYRKYSFTNIFFKILEIILKNNDMYYKLMYKDLLNNAKEGDIAISIGGDTYCYEGIPKILSFLNKSINDKGVKTVLMGCSIEPELLKNQDILNDLERYSVISARETITYNALTNAGLKNVVLIPDSAFVLEKEDVKLLEGFIEDKTVGINVSPLIQRLENGDNITYDNYYQLIKYIIENTENNVALIPHVVWNNNNDLEPLLKLYNDFKETKRIVLVKDNNAINLKGYISKCRLFVGARTHSTIAAYSTFVPTLTVGYSVKAKGIAKDLFGTNENYVISVQSLKKENDLVKAFKWLEENENNIKNKLVEIMPDYIKNVSNITKEVNKLIGGLNEE